MFAYLRLVQLPSSGGTCMMSLFCRSRVDNLSSSFSRTGSMAPTWLLLIKIVSRVKMLYSTSGKLLNLRKIKERNWIWTRIRRFIFSPCLEIDSLFRTCVLQQEIQEDANWGTFKYFQLLLIKWQDDAPQLGESLQLYWQRRQQIISREKSNYIGDNAVRSH